MAKKERFAIRVGYVWVDRFDKPQADLHEVELDLSDPVQNRLYESQKFKLEDVESGKRHRQELEDKRAGRMMASPQNRMMTGGQQRSPSGQEKPKDGDKS